MQIVIADESHINYALEICKTIALAAEARGTGIAKRTPEYIAKKLKDSDAVIALDGELFVGFCYIEQWSHGKFVANSGLIVHPSYRGLGVAKIIKKKIFEHSRNKYPNAKVFSITTGLAVMKLNADLGYKPVTFSELTTDETFWNGCKTCKNYDVLQRTNKSMCLCTGMLYNPEEKLTKKKTIKLKVAKRLQKIKQAIYLNKR